MMEQESEEVEDWLMEEFLPDVMFTSCSGELKRVT